MLLYLTLYYTVVFYSGARGGGEEAKSIRRQNLEVLPERTAVVVSGEFAESAEAREARASARRLLRNVFEATAKRPGAPRTAQAERSVYRVNHTLSPPYYPPKCSELCAECDSERFGGY